MTSDGTNTYTYQGNQLTSVSNSTNTDTFDYNPDGIRIDKTVNGVKTNYLLNGSQITAQWNSTNRLYFTYDKDGSLISVNLNGTNYYYVLDLQGNVIALEDTNGTIVVRYQYDSWGNILGEYDSNGNPISLTDTSSIANINPFRYRSYYYDSETNLYYLNSRYYNPATGRFISADSQLNSGVLGNNMYIYCDNNPVMNVDPNGNSFQSWLKDKWDRLKGWWNEVPDTSKSSGSIDVTDLLFSALGTTLDTKTVKAKYIISNTEDAKVLGTFSTFLIGGKVAYDTYHIWRDDNGNTNGKRVEETGINLLCTGEEVGIGIVGVPLMGLSVAASPVITPFGSVICIGGIIGAEYGLDKLIDYDKSLLYNQLDIK